MEKIVLTTDATENTKNRGGGVNIFSLMISEL